MDFESKVIYRNDDIICSVTTPVSLSLSDMTDDLDAIHSARDFFNDLTVLPIQTHSLNVGIIDKWSAGMQFPDTDALISFDNTVSIGVITADCVPILLYARDIKGVAAIHAGWKGTIGGIVDNVLDILMARGADISKISAIFGPSISAKVYEVDYELAKKFSDAGFDDYISYPDGVHKKPHLDLQGINAKRLADRGLQIKNINVSADCTFSTTNTEGTPIYPSYRRNATPLRLMTSISLVNP